MLRRCPIASYSHLQAAKSGFSGPPFPARGRAMKATIWHNPNCGTSRKTLAILEKTPGLELQVVEYVTNPPSAEKLAQLYRDAGIGPRDGLRLRGTDAEERGLPAASDPE